MILHEERLLAKSKEPTYFRNIEICQKTWSKLPTYLAVCIGILKSQGNELARKLNEAEICSGIFIIT